MATPRWPKQVIDSAAPHRSPCPTGNTVQLYPKPHEHPMHSLPTQGTPCFKSVNSFLNELKKKRIPGAGEEYFGRGFLGSAAVKEELYKPRSNVPPAPHQPFPGKKNGMRQCGLRKVRNIKIPLMEIQRF